MKAAAELIPLTALASNVDVRKPKSYPAAAAGKNAKAAAVNVTEFVEALTS